MAPANKAKEDPIQVGEVLAGKYRVERVLGVGGMGAVVAARHVDLDELRAIKFMKPEMRTNAQAEQRFMREARAAAKLKSDHVARVHDIGRFETGEPYMVIEYLDGEDLKVMLKRTGPLDPELAVVFILQACEALAEAHAAGIVHRDLKPSNLFVVEGTDGRPKLKVLDFGISKLTGALAEEAGMDLTHTFAVMGSPLYMSPEQMASTRDIDARTDVWSLGVIFFQLVTGKRPFRGKTVTAVTISVTNDRPPPPSTLRAGLPEQLDDIIMRCLEKDPDRRYTSVAELAGDLALLAPAHARGLIDKIERVAARTPAPRSARSTGSGPGISGSFDSVESGSRPIINSTARLAANAEHDESDDAATVRTGDSEHLRGSDAPAEQANTAATWHANTESIELPTHKRQWALLGTLAVCAGAVLGMLVFSGSGKNVAETSSAPLQGETAHPAAPSQPATASATTPTPPRASSLPTASAPPSASLVAPSSPPPPPVVIPRPAPAPVVVPAVPNPPASTPRPKPGDPFGPGWRD